jgi:hypothetical protein
LILKAPAIRRQYYPDARLVASMVVPLGFVRKLDELVRTDLQNLRDAYFYRLVLSAAVVAIGVLLEGPEVIHETKAVFRRQPESRARRPWITLVALVGWILVVLGVAGEGIAERYVSQADGLLQEFTNILLNDAVKETAFAIAQAEIAKTAAGDANARASGLQKEAEKLRQRNLETEAELEDERKTRLELEATLAPRTISLGKGWGELGNVKSVAAFRGVQFILWSIYDAEARRAAGAILMTLKSCDWVEVSSHASLDLDTPDGVELGYRLYPPSDKSGDRSMAAAEALREYLKDNGWTDVSMRAMPYDPRQKEQPPAPAANTVVIQVGLKPSTYFLPKQWKKLHDQIEDMKDKALRQRFRPPTKP